MLLENVGHLDLNKVYALMQEMEKHQNNAVTFKNMSIALAIFAVLLALATIGTSFAAATLAKETTYNSNGDMVGKGTEDIIGVNDKVEMFPLEDDGPDDTPFDDVNQTVIDALMEGDGGRHRHLIDRHLTGRNLDKKDNRKFRISHKHADNLFKKLCNGWKGIYNYKGDTFKCGKGSKFVKLEHWYVTPILCYSRCNFLKRLTRPHAFIVLTIAAVVLPNFITIMCLSI